MEQTLKRKLREQERQAKASQKELREYLLTKKDMPPRQAVKADEIISLADNYDSPYMFTYGWVLWGGLKRSWLGYKIGKRLGEEGGDRLEQIRQKECAVKVQKIEKLLNVDVDEFKCLKDETS